MLHQRAPGDDGLAMADHQMPIVIFGIGGNIRRIFRLRRPYLMHGTLVSMLSRHTSRANASSRFRTEANWRSASRILVSISAAVPTATLPYVCLANLAA